MLKLWELIIMVGLIEYQKEKNPKGRKVSFSSSLVFIDYFFLPLSAKPTSHKSSLCHSVIIFFRVAIFLP
jgi:hypothetical protein